MVSIDIYLNETTRHAHVILPGLSPLEQSHFPLAFTQLAVRNFVRYSRPAFPVPAGQMPEWQIVLRLAAIAAGQGPAADIDALDDFAFAQQLEKALASEHSPAHGRDADEIRAALAGRRGPERLLDLMLRTGPYGDGFGAREGLTLARLEQSDQAIDLGALAPRMPEVLRTPSGKIELAPEAIVADLARLRTRLAEHTSASAGGERPLLLVGRRDLRSNNSWMHNVQALVSGKARCTLHLHPSDHRGHHARRRQRAARLGPRRKREPSQRRTHRRRREQQPSRRGGPFRPAVRQRGAERHRGPRRAERGEHRSCLTASRGLRRSRLAPRARTAQ
jgi:anaerobic selenocysteine-containing dehydrogenase